MTITDDKIVSVGFAKVLRGARSFKDAGISNLSDTYRGQIVAADGTISTAFIKDIPIGELANEVMAAALAYSVSIPVPRSYIAIADPADLPGVHGPLLGPSRIMFASVDAQTPSLSQFVVDPFARLDVAKLVPFILEMKSAHSLGRFFGFDAWTANVDRHVGNILFSGSGDLWLIDHGRCFTGPNWGPNDLTDPGEAFRHRMSEWLTPFLSAPERSQYANDAAAESLIMSKVDLLAVAKASALDSLLDQPSFDALISFLGDRTQFVPKLTSAALNISVVV